MRKIFENNLAMSFSIGLSSFSSDTTADWIGLNNSWPCWSEWIPKAKFVNFETTWRIFISTSCITEIIYLRGMFRHYCFLLLLLCRYYGIYNRAITGVKIIFFFVFFTFLFIWKLYGVSVNKHLTGYYLNGCTNRRKRLLVCLCFYQNHFMDE